MFIWTSSSSVFQANLPAAISAPISSRHRLISDSSLLVSSPTFSNMVAWATEPRISCAQSLQSKEIDSVKSATSSAGPEANLPLRETGELFFLRFKTPEICGQPEQKSRAKRGGEPTVTDRPPGFGLRQSPPLWHETANFTKCALCRQFKAKAAGDCRSPKAPPDSTRLTTSLDHFKPV